MSKFEEPRPTPKWLAYEVIEKTFAVMRENATKARLMLMAYAGFRPSEVIRAQPADVLPFLDLPEPFCLKRVGKGGVPVMVPLPPKGVAAWQLLIAKNGWGHFQHDAVIGVRSAMEVVMTLPHAELDRVWSFVMAGHLRHAWLAFISPNYNKALVMAVSFSSELEE